MEFLRNLLNSEPALVISGVTAFLSLAIAFGAPISDAQVSAIVQATGVLFAIAQVAAGVAIRQAVFSPATHDEDVAAAAEAASR